MLYCGDSSKIWTQDNGGNVKNGSVVMIDESDWSNIKETLPLLSDKESLAALLESQAIGDRGEKPECFCALGKFSAMYKINILKKA